MKVYVCFTTIPWEGCSPPVKVFKSKEKAEDWCRHENKPHSKYLYAEYEEFDIE